MACLQAFAPVITHRQAFPFGTRRGLGLDAFGTVADLRLCQVGRTHPLARPYCPSKLELLQLSLSGKFALLCHEKARLSREATFRQQSF